jgi:hypothetical protein
VAAPAWRVYGAVRGLDLSGSRLTRALFRLRGLPAEALSLEGLLRSGFVLLADRPPSELVLGLIARPWRPGGGIVRVEPGDFRGWAEPGYAKIAWNFTVTATATRGSRIATGTRVRSTDGWSRIRFRCY